MSVEEQKELMEVLMRQAGMQTDVVWVRRARVRRYAAVPLVRKCIHRPVRVLPFLWHRAAHVSPGDIHRACSFLASADEIRGFPNILRRL